MTSLLDELKADQDPRLQCRFCVWLESLSPKDRHEWATAMADRSFTNTSLLRASKKRGYPHGEGSLVTHRKNGHAAG